MVHDVAHSRLTGTRVRDNHSRDIEVQDAAAFIISHHDKRRRKKRETQVMLNAKLKGNGKFTMHKTQ
jgi:hypothetical protein